ncbi:MAG: pimeloyl-ACP methyl ester esterase BioH [Proteobacteria bacterium]|nr:pimeloyl-ACP methyl ester esterase BioH [Pseudomonadota bacterium]
MSELYVEVSGNGPDLVLLHGWGLNVRVWDGLVAELRDRFRLIAVDLPGHGKSTWAPGRNTPAEQAWLLHSTLTPISNRYSLLGWSLGGQIALDLAAAMPAQIDRLVLVATTPRFTATSDWPYGMKLEAITKMATQLREDYQRTVRDFLDLQVRGSIDGPSVVEQLRNALSVHGEAAPEALAAGLNTLATSDLRSTLPHVRTPTLVIAGQNDRITAPAASRVLATNLPDARYVEMRRAAHAPFLSHRKEFIAVLEQFLRSGELDFGGEPVSAEAGKAAVRAVAPSPTPAPAHTPSSASGVASAPETAPTIGAAKVTGARGSSTRPAKKKRMKARARKKLKASHR